MRRQPRLLLGLEQHFQPFAMQSLEGVWGGAGLEGPAAQKRGPRRLDLFRHQNDLPFTLHRAWARDDLEMTAAQRQTAAIDHRVHRVEFAVGLLERLLDALDVLHDVQGLDQVNVDARRVTDQPQHRMMHTLRLIDDEMLASQPVLQVLHLLGIRILFEDDNHSGYLAVRLKKKKNPAELQHSAGFMASFLFPGFIQVP